MKVLIYGAGIQGSFLAHSLLKNKRNKVTLLARGKRKKELEESGLVLTHSIQRRTTREKITVIDRLEPADYFDLIFVTMKYNDFDSVIDILAENVSPTIVFVGNQVDTQLLATKINKRSSQPKKILFGFQNTGGTRNRSGMTVLRFNKGKMKIGSNDAEIKLSHPLSEAFADTGYRWQEDSTLDEWLKSHAALIMIMNCLNYLFDNDLKKIRRSTEWLTIAANAYSEVFLILEKNGYHINPIMLKKAFNHPQIAKVLLKTVYSTPIMGMAEGDFAEIMAIIAVFNQFKEREDVDTPNFDQLTTVVTEKFQAEYNQL